jgi:hypothetical protein
MATAGGCRCGAIRFSVAADHFTTRICWCRVYQYLGAGNGMVSVCFPSSSFSIQGEARWFESIADGGNHMQRSFCPSCGAPLFSRAEARPHLIFIRAGALDNPKLVAPTMSIWTDASPEWACFDPALPKAPGQPPLPVAVD